MAKVYIVNMGPGSIEVMPVPSRPTQDDLDKLRPVTVVPERCHKLVEVDDDQQLVVVHHAE